MYSKKLGALIVSNGEKMWTYDEKRNEVFVTPPSSARLSW